MNRDMFNYSKMILQKVSFDVSLFKKEVQKAYLRLMPSEVQEFNSYVHSIVNQNPNLKNYRDANNSKFLSDTKRFN